MVGGADMIFVAEIVVEGVIEEEVIVAGIVVVNGDDSGGADGAIGVDGGDGGVSVYRVAGRESLICTGSRDRGFWFITHGCLPGGNDGALSRYRNQKR